MLPLVCCDVDGTLVGEGGEPTAGVWEAARRAVDRGQRLSLCTARLAAGPTRAWAEHLDPEGWHMFHSGGAILRPSDGAVRAHPLPEGAAAQVSSLAADRGWVLELYSVDDYVVDDDHPLAVAHADLLGMPFRRRPLDDLHGAVVRAQLVVPIGETDAALEAASVGCHASAATSPVMPEAAFVSITSSEVSKAHAIAEVAGMLGASLADVMMVGDGHNDREAVAAVGHGVAMGNAEPELLGIARYVVADVAHDGLAEAFDLSGRLERSA